MSSLRWKDAPTRTVDVGGVKFAYRDLGIADSEVPVVFLHNSGHGGVFQHHVDFVPAALAFLNGSGEARR